MSDRVRPLPPWWADRFDLLDELVDRYEHPDDTAPIVTLDVDEPRIVCQFDEDGDA